MSEETSRLVSKGPLVLLSNRQPLASEDSPRSARSGGHSLAQFIPERNPWRSSLQREVLQLLRCKGQSFTQLAPKGSASLSPLQREVLQLLRCKGHPSASVVEPGARRTLVCSLRTGLLLLNRFGPGMGCGVPGSSQPSVLSSRRECESTNGGAAAQGGIETRQQSRRGAECLGSRERVGLPGFSPSGGGTRAGQS